MQKKHRPYISQANPIFIFCCFLALLQCKPAQESASSTDSTATDTVGTLPQAVEAEYPEENVVIHDIIEYGGAADDEIKTTLTTLSPFAAVQELARLSIQVKDSLEATLESQELVSPKDSVIFRPYEIKAYKAILEYKKLMTSGSSIKDNHPTLLQLNRATSEGDSTFTVLPPVGDSKLLAHGNFFFLGGAPFISKIRKDDIDVFTDAKGNPETHFTIATENTDYLLTSMYHFKNVKFNITFGPPLNSYDFGPQEVNGIGSLIHTFDERIPVFFLTKTGLIQGHFTSIKMKLVPEYLGCVADLPEPEFVCSKNLSENDILGIYIPYDTTPITTCNVTQQDYVWTADLNGDGIADVAAVSSNSFGEASGDTLSEMLWFVNINGTWKIIDWGHELDCT
jgi:hypothetical protein